MTYNVLIITREYHQHVGSGITSTVAQFANYEAAETTCEGILRTKGLEEDNGLVFQFLRLYKKA
jgi:hypothetical protein